MVTQTRLSRHNKLILVILIIRNNSFFGTNDFSNQVYILYFKWEM